MDSGPRLWTRILAGYVLGCTGWLACTQRKEKPGTGPRLVPGLPLNFSRSFSFGVAVSRFSVATNPFDGVAVPECALFGSALLGFVVDSDDSEPLLVAVGPLEVVHQGPGEVSTHIRACLAGLGDSADVLLEVLHSIEVPDE